jgi:hypothetical protein
MRSYSIEVRLADDTISDREDRIGTLEDAVGAALALADKLSEPGQTAHPSVLWVDLYEVGSLVISVQVIPGFPLTGR